MSNGMNVNPGSSIDPDRDLILEDLPDAVIATMELRDRWSTRAASGEEFVVADLLAWQPGQTVRVAFFGGDSTLHREIAEATQQITDACNVQLDFGLNPATGTFRTWSTSDTTLQAEIRVSFDQTGFFSLVGTDSSNPIIGGPFDPVGGRPHQRSLNLEGFDVQKPTAWRRTVRHEFLHALAFHHEHQSPAGNCDDEFRWQDDPGYQPTTDAQGRFTTDAQGRRPGIYTFLAGPPNRWSKRKVDHNLRQREPMGLTTGPFDRASIMLYRFQSLFYRTIPSPCAPLGDGENLSAGDIAGLLHIYPRESAAVEAIATRRSGLLTALAGAESASADFRASVQTQRDLYSK